MKFEKFGVVLILFGLTNLVIASDRNLLEEEQDKKLKKFVKESITKAENDLVKPKTPYCMNENYYGKLSVDRLEKIISSIPWSFDENPLMFSAYQDYKENKNKNVKLYVEILENINIYGSEQSVIFWFNLKKD